MFGIRIRRIIHYPAVSGSGGYFYIRIRRYPESPDTGIYRIPVSPHPNISELFESTLNLCIYTQRQSTDLDLCSLTEVMSARRRHTRRVSGELRVIVLQQGPAACSTDCRHQVALPSHIPVSSSARAVDFRPCDEFIELKPEFARGHPTIHPRVRLRAATQSRILCSPQYPVLITHNLKF